MIQTKRKTTLGINSSPKISGAQNRLSNGSKLNKLLDDEMISSISPPISQKNAINDSSHDFSNFRMRVNRYEYPRLGKVPAITYRSKIADMSVRQKNGKEILDVNYDLIDCFGREYHITQSYPAGSEPYRRFADALAAAGVPDDATADAGIGTEEIIEIDYLSKSHDLGSIVNRRPYADPSGDQEDDVDELLDDEE